MTETDLAFETAITLAARLDRRELSAVELCDIFLGRIEWLNPRSKAFIQVAETSARAAAKAWDASSNESRDEPLGGVPYAVKDLIDVKGVLTTAGSRVLHDNLAANNAFCVDRLEAAGGVVLGKANLHEFAYGATGENEVYGTAVNAYDETRLACGSSSGSAAAVAFGLCPFALGTDTGGSVRVPAVLNGLVGLKPTLGRISTSGVIPFCWSCDHVGTLTRDAADAALLLDLIAGHDSQDSNSSEAPKGRYREALRRSVSGLRVGVPRSFFFERADREILDATESVLRVLDAAGAKVVETDLPSMEHARTVALTVQMPEALSYHARYLEDRGDLYSQDFRAGLALGQCLLAEHYVRAKRFIEVYRLDTNRAFEEVDVLLTPATPTIAPKLGATKITFDGVEEAVGNAVTRYTTFFNMTGHPALTMPVGLHSEGLPIGVQIVGRHFDEETVLAVAAAIERQDEFAVPAPQIS